MKTIKIGMVGAGAISETYIENISKTFRDIELIAICDVVKERAEAAKATYGIPKVYPTMEDMFADSEIDIILNLTRPNEHYAVTKAALLAGKHVYSEKPLATTVEEGKELVALAMDQHLMLGGAPDTFLGAGVQTCRKLIDSGFIGRPIGAAAFMMCRGHESWHPNPAFYYQAGGGPMMDMGPYYITALVNLLGGVSSVMGSAKRSFEERVITSQPRFGEKIPVEVPTHINGIMNFENGAVGTILTTFDVCYPGQARLEIYGTEGTLFVPDPNTFGGPVKLLHREDKHLQEIPLCFDYAEESRGLGLADMAKAIQTGRDMRAGWQQTLHVLEIMTSFEKSSSAGALVPIESKYQRGKPMPGSGLHGVLDA